MENDNRTASNRRKMYESLSKKFDIGDFDTFNKKMDNPDSQRRLYDAVKDVFDVRDFDTFSRYVSNPDIKTTQTSGIDNVTSYSQNAVNKESIENDIVNIVRQTSVPEYKQEPGLQQMVDNANRSREIKPTYVPSVQQTDAVQAPRPVVPIPIRKDTRIRDEEAEIDNTFTAMPENTEEDVYRNFYGRFSLTERGKSLQKEMADKEAEVQNKYLGEFQKSPEYLEYANQKYASKEEAEAADKRINELFAEKYSAAIDKDMKPYQDAYYSAVIDRYGDQINEHTNSIVKRNAADQLDQLQRDIDTSVLDNKKKLQGYSANDARGALQSSYNYSMNGDVAKHRQDAGALEAANRLTEEAKEIVKEASKKGKTNFVAGLLRGFRDNAFDPEQWSMGIVDLADNTYLFNALQKFDRGEKLSDAEEKLLEASSVNMIVNAYYAQDLGRGYKAGQVTAQSLPFMLEFVANPISASGSTLAKGLLKYAGKAFGKDITKRASIKMGTRFLGDLGAAAGMTLTTGAAGTLADAQQRMIDNYDYGKDSGVMRVEKTGDTGFGEALGRAALSRTVENQSEMIFNTLRAGGPLVKSDVVSKVPFFNKLANSDIVKLANKWKDVPTVKNIRQRAQIGGVLEEYGEEVYNNMVSVATGEMDGNDAFSLDTNIDTFLGLVPTQLAFAALGVGGAAIQESKSRKKVREFQRNMNPEDQTQFEEFRQAVEMGDYETVPRNYIRSIIEDNTKSDEEKRTMIFAVREEVMAHKAQEVKESQTEPEDVAYNEGHSGDIAGTANNLDRLEEEAMRITGAANQEELNELLDTYERNGRGDTKAQRIADAMYRQEGRDDEAVRIMLDYLNADAKFKGASNYVMDRVDEAVEEENSKIDAITHKGGFIQPATMKNDHPVYITSGNIVTLPDGTIDREKSDQDIIVFDQTTGRLEFTTAEQIMEMGLQANPEEIKTQNSEIVSQQIISESEMMMNAQVVEESQQDASTNEPEATTLKENQDTLTEEVDQTQEIPVDEEGEPIFTGINPSLAIDYIYNKSGLEEQDADEFVNQKIAESAKNAAGIEKKKPKVGSKIGAYKRELAAWETERDAAQEELNYWTNIQNQVIQSRNQPKAIEQQQEIIDVVESDVPDVVNDKAIDARTRGYRMVNGYRVDRPSPIRSNQGANIEIRFSTKDAVPGRFAIVEASSLQPSHVNGQRNPYFFINEAQPKDRVDDASIKAADDIASAIRPEEITGGVTAYTGSPVVNIRGEVVQGNNRSAALRTMYQSNSDQSEIYKEYLRNHAADYGLTEEQVDEMEQPVLVRIADVSDVQAIRLGQMTAQDTESGGIERIKPVQTYNKMGDSAGSFVNILLNSEDENSSLADLVAENGVAALKYLAQKQAISDTQYQSAFDRNGNLTPEAKQDLTQIVEASLFEGGPDLLPQMFRIMPAKSQKAILSTFSRDRNSEESKQIRKDIHNAIQVFYEAMQDADFASATNYESAKRALESWKRQINMMDGVAPMEKFDNFAIELAARLKGNTMKRTAEEFNAFYNLIQGEQDLFSESGPVSKNEAINQIYNVENESRRENAPDVEDNTGRGEERGSGSNRDGSSGELNPEGERIADTGRGIESNDRQDVVFEEKEVDPVGDMQELVNDVLEETNKEIEGKQTFVVSSEYEIESLRDFMVADEFIEALLSGFRNPLEAGRYLPQLDSIFIWVNQAILNQGNRKNLKATVYHENVHGLSYNNRYSKEEFASFASMIREAYPHIAYYVDREYADQTESIKNEEIVCAYIEMPVNEGWEEELLNGSLELENDTEAIIKERNHVINLLKDRKYARREENSDIQDGMLELQERSGNGRNEVGMSSQGNKNRQPLRSIQKQGRTGTGKEVRLSERTGLADKNDESKEGIAGDKLTQYDLKESPESANAIRMEIIANRLSEIEYRLSELDEEQGMFSEAERISLNMEKSELESEYDGLRTTNAISKAIQEAEAEVNQNPTEAQKEAGNYKKGHLKLDGYDITIENPKGSERSGTDKNGTTWSIKMNNTYGYIRGTESVDGDHIDVFLSDNPSEGNVFVVDQIDQETGEFDEHKVMYGFNSIEEAKAAYLSNYSDGWKIGTVTEVSKDEFNKWISSSKRKTKPFAEYKSIKENVAQNESKGEKRKIKDTTESNEIDKIEDVGEKIGGARKDLMAEYAERAKKAESDKVSMLDEIARLPLSKIFNFPYEKLRAEGVSNEMISLLQTIRKVIPSKPRTKYKLERWAENTFMLYRFSLELVTNGTSMQDEFIERALEIGQIGSLYNAYMALGGFDGRMDTGSAELQQLGESAGHYDKDGNWESVKGQWWLSKAGRYSGIYKTLEEAKEALKKFSGKNEQSKRENKVKFAVYTKSNTNEIFIAVDGKPKIVVQSGFKSTKEAFAYIKEHYDELAGKYGNIKEAASIGFRENMPRKGKDWRGGKDITAEEFRETFGFRGVEFGNWVNQEERQTALNNTYDALMDLAEAIEKTPRSLSLNGELAMAFGARGGGNAMAHYEPNKVVINLTKTKGVGSLAHEWWHAIDNYFARRRGDNHGYNTSQEGYRFDSTERKRRNERERGELTDAFDNLVRALNKSDYGVRSERYASLKSSYWSRPTELGARAFSMWVERKLAERGISNDFLANNPILWENESVNQFYPYPIESEFETLDPAFDNLFNTIQEKVDEETGNIALFNIGKLSENTMTVEQQVVFDSVMGMLDDAGIETHILSNDAMNEMANAKQASLMTVYHGSGAQFDAFDHSHMGEGEGAQAYGWGSYVTEVEGIGRSYATAAQSVHFIGDKAKLKEGLQYDYVVDDVINDIIGMMRRGDSFEEVSIRAKSYWNNRFEPTHIDKRKVLSRLKLEDFYTGRNLYTVEIPDNNGKNYLEYDGHKDLRERFRKPLENDGFKLTNQTEVFDRYEKGDDFIVINKNASGADIYEELKIAFNSDREASEFLHDDVGFTGISYPAQAMSGGRSDGARNYVIFNEEDLKIKDRISFMRTKKKSAPETVSVLEEHQPTAISSADGTKILNNLDSLAKAYENSPKTEEKTFIGKVANAFGISRTGSSSRYATIETANGQTVTIRLSNHNATVSNFDNVGEAEGISIVVSPKKNAGVRNDGSAHIVEYYYDSIKLRKADGKPLSEIVRGIRQALMSGEYTDTTGLAQVQEVNAATGQRNEGGTVYGATVGGKIYLNGSALNPESPLHEYTHIWDEACRRNNPELWNRGVELMKQTPMWEEVKNDPNYSNLQTDNEIASEVHSRLTGADGADRMERMVTDARKNGAIATAEAISLREQLKKWLSDFWWWLKDTMIPWTKEESQRISLEDFINMPLKDLANGINLNNTTDENVRFRIGETGSGILDKYDRGQIVLEQYRDKGINSDNVNLALYDLFGVFAGRLYENGVLGNVLKEATINEEKAKEEYERAEIYLNEYATVLNDLKDNSTEAAKDIIDEEINDIKRSIQYYKELAEGKDVWRWDIPRFKASKGEIDKIIRKSKENDTYMKAPNGADTNLTEKQWAQVRTKAFKDWFGDWENDPENASKVIDKNGEPLVVYHGTDSTFSIFDPKKLGENTDFNASNENWAKTSHIGNWFNTEKIGFYSSHMPVFLNIRNPYVTSSVLSLTDDLENYVSGEDFREKNSEDFDSVIVKSDEGMVGTSFAVFSSNQAKSATENTGEFSSDNPDIRYNTNIFNNNVIRFGKMLNANVDLIFSINDIENKSARAAIENGYNVKGWFEPSTGRVVLYMPNIENEADAQATILHEIVGHKGLRELFGDRFDKFLYDVFSRAEEPIRRQISRKMMQPGSYGRIDVATEEYLAEMAERGFKENERGFWNMVKRLFSDLLHEARIRLGFTLRDSDLRYILWRSYQLQRERGALAEAANIAMKQNLGLNETPNEVRFRISSQSQEQIEYDNILKKWGYKFQEAYQDSMLALKKLQEIVSKKSGPILDSENAYMAENQLSSKNKIESEIYRYRFFNPMIDAVTQFMEESNVSYDEVLTYLIAKHGLERNRVFALRDAIDATENPEETAQKIDEEQSILMNDKEAGKLDDMAYEVELENMYKKLAPEYENFRKRDYSGLKALTGSENNYESEAKAIVDTMEMSGDTNSLWDAINKATKETLKKSYESGMMNRKQYDHVNKMFEYYVPLRGWSEDVASDVYEYLINERSIFNAPVMRAGGRTSLADDPLATIGSMAESAIIQGNKNLMKQKFLNLALNHKTPLLSVGSIWYKNVGSEEKPEWQESLPDIPVDATTDEMNRILEEHEEMMKSLQKEGRATKKRSKIKLNYKSSKKEQQEHAVRVKRNGTEYIIYVNGNPRAAQAINGLTNPDSYDHKVLRAISWINRQMAANFTSRNPAFVLTNLSRDLIFAGTAVAVKEDGAYRKRYTRNILSIFGKAKTFSLIRSLERDELGDSEVEIYFKEFIENGGETGYTNLNSVDEYKKMISKQVLDAQGSVDLGSFIGLNYGRVTVNSKAASPVLAIKAVARWTELFNRSAEDMTRFAVYMTSRQMGRSIQRSVSDAKEITVNFNKKGAGGLGATTFKALYLFFNAAVQSLTNFGRLAKNNPGRFTAMIGSTMILGILLPMANKFMINAFGDDDDKDAYYNLPEWVRRNNLIFWLGGDRFLTIPLPIEMRAFYGLGELFLSHLEGKNSDNIGVETIKQFSDLLPLDMTGNGGDFVANIMPDAIKPIYQIYSNKDYFGKPVYKDYDYNKMMPEWTKAYAGTNKDLITLAKKLNDISGGTKYRKGLIDINPAVVEHLFDSYFGGLGKTVNQTYKTIFSVWDEDLRNSRNIPVLNRFYTKEDERSAFGLVNNKYYGYLKEFDQTQQELSGYKKEYQKGVFEYAEELNELVTSPRYKRYQVISLFNKNTAGLKKAINITSEQEGRKKLEQLFNVEKARLVEMLDKINE